MAKPPTIKGRVGEFEYGHVGSQSWIVRDRRTGETVGTARDLSGASQRAIKAHETEFANDTEYRRQSMRGQL